MEDDVLICEQVGPIARLTLNRPAAMNALNMPMVAAFEAALDAMAAREDVRVVLITGAGQAFCAGADLKDALLSPPAGERDFLARASDLMARVRGLAMPVIAALNGLTLAGGLELALCADVIIAADTARIGDAHANFAAFPGAGGSAVLPRRLPAQTALYLLLTDKSLPASRLYDLGLISEIHPADKVADAALELARHMAAKSPGVLRRMKAVARTTADKPLDDALLHEQDMLREHLRSEDFQIGMRAFAEKQTPVFTGR